MNKDIDQKLKIARKTMAEYTTAAGALAQAICDHMLAEKGWKCTWHLGGEEAGMDTIVISAGCHCFDEACGYEMKIRDALEDCNFHGPSIEVRSTNYSIIECEQHKLKYG